MLDNGRELVKAISRVFLGKISVHDVYTVGHRMDVLGLQHELVRAEYPTGETPQLADTFIKQFLDVRSDLL